MGSRESHPVGADEDHRLMQGYEKQLIAVGSHWPLSGPLPQEMREKMERAGVCMEITRNNLMKTSGRKSQTMVG
jgi:hypothetical protein